MPQGAVDPIVAGAQLVTLLQTIASREIAPQAPVVVTVGSLHSGTTFNVIPERAALQGTVRAFDDAVRQIGAGAHGTHGRGLVRGDAPRVSLRVPLGLSADGQRRRMQRRGAATSGANSSEATASSIRTTS